MSRGGTPIIGFDRRIDREWLDAAAELMASGLPVAEVRDGLRAVLRPFVSGEKYNTALGKTLTVLTRLWIAVPVEDVPLRDAALAAWPHCSEDERLALHWAILLRAYPFFRDVATLSGRFLKLHETVEASLVTRRMVEAWGERSTVPRAVQRVLRSMVQWGVLAESGRRGVYCFAGVRRPIPGVVGWFHDERPDAPRTELTRARADVFPFDLAGVASARAPLAPDRRSG